MNYEEDIKIDEQALDVEWLEQGELALKYAKHASEMEKEAARAEERVKTIRSELINEVNADSDGTIGKSKPNAADIEAYYRTRQRYKEAKDDAVEKRNEADFAELARREVSTTRRKALEQLVNLHGQMYFAGPSVPRDLTQQKEEKQKQANQKVKTKRKK